jgi:sulfur-oxidizing protein SoxX
MPATGMRPRPPGFSVDPMTAVSRILAVLLMCLLPLAAKAGDVSSVPLTATQGDPARGQDIIRDTGRASCLICHTISAMPDRDQGTLGPPLDAVAMRYSEAELRQRIVDARAVAPDTIMPPYYSNAGLVRIGSRWAQSTIYSAQDVEDVVAFLMTLGD